LYTPPYHRDWLHPASSMGARVWTPPLASHSSDLDKKAWICKYTLTLPLCGVFSDLPSLVTPRYYATATFWFTIPHCFCQWLRLQHLLAGWGGTRSRQSVFQPRFEPKSSLSVYLCVCALHLSCLFQSRWLWATRVQLMLSSPEFLPPHCHGLQLSFQPNPTQPNPTQPNLT
jgi:hypothetical protein